MNEGDIERLYRARAAHFVGLAQWLVGSRDIAEEVVHDVFVRLVAKSVSLRDESALEAYVRRAVVNRAKNRHRRKAVEQKHAPTENEVTIDRYNADETVRNAVLALPLRQRQCVVLRFYDDLTLEQIGQTLGMRTGTVKSHLHRAMAALRPTLGEGASL